jgi:carbamoyltransferase
MTAILGISAFYHDAAAAIVVDGTIVAAAQEERFTRKKHDWRFPLNAIEYCLGEASLQPDQLDFVGFYDKPLLKFDRLLETYLAYAPVGIRSFLTAMPLWLRLKLHLPREVSAGLGGRFHKRYVFLEHHESHAASAFFPSPFDESAILTLDGVGEWATASFGTGRGNHIELTHELHFPHSLGLLYSAFTYFTGFRVNSGEYKLMGLAPYGQPIYADLIREKLLDLKPDGSFRLDMSYFDYCAGLRMTSKKFHRLFGASPRPPETPIRELDMDLAASIQAVTEEIMLRCACHVHAETGMKRLCLAGGVALNAVANGRLLREGPFDDIWIQPAAGDAGGALGVALFIWHQLLGSERTVDELSAQRGSLLGPSFSSHEICSYLDEVGAVYRRSVDEDELCRHVARQIADQKVVGWMQGRMEFGPRALGSRSILGDPRSETMQSLMNLKIKFRESFRPFAPAVLQDKASEYFQIEPHQESPYMLLVAQVQPSKCESNRHGGKRPAGLERRNEKRSCIAAVTHIDNSARVQTVDAVRNGRFYKLLKSFESHTGCPLIINTSFNVRGEPIVCSPADAYRCFMATNMDLLIIEDVVLKKEEQPEAQLEARTRLHLSEFELD